MRVAPTGHALVLSGPNPHSLNAAKTKTTMASPEQQNADVASTRLYRDAEDVTNRKNGKEDRGYRVMSE